MPDESSVSVDYALSDNELRLFETIPGNNVLLVANPPNFTIAGVSEGYLHESGKERDQFLNHGMFEIFPSNNPADTGENNLRFSLDEVIKHKKKHVLITRYDVLNEDGGSQERHWNVSNTPLLDEAGNVKYIIHSLQEITSQVEAKQEEARIKMLEQEHSLFMHAPIAIQILRGLECVIELANEPTLLIWQKGKEVIGKPLAEILPELQEQGFIDMVNQVRETGETYEAYETPAKMIRGGKEERLYFNLVCKPYYEEDKEKAVGVLVFASEVTDKIIARQALKQTEEENTKLASIIEASHEFIGLADPDSSIVYLNPAALQMLGWSDIEGKQILDCIYPEDRPLALQLLPTLIKEDSFSHEIRFWNEKANEHTWVLWNAFTIKNPSSHKLIGLATVSTNITSRKKTEQALKDSNDRFRAAIEAVQGILWTNDAEGKMVGEQKGWANLTGQSYEDYQGYGWSRALHPEDAEATVAAWYEALRHRKTYVFEHRVKTKDGDWRLFSVLAIPLKNEDGTIREWVGVHTDITERRTVEQQIRESEERFRKLADDSPIFVFIITPQAEVPVNYWNKTWLNYTGQSLEGAIGSAWSTFIHPDDVPVVMESYTSAFEKRQSYLIPAVRVKRYDGEYRWHSFKGNPRYLNNGEFNGYVGVGFDIHEQKSVEEAIKHSEAQLQMKVAERTAELENQKTLLDNILANSSNGISVTEMIRNDKGDVDDANTILANNAAVQFTGLPKDIYLSKTAKELDPDILESAYGKTCLKTLETGVPSLIQYFLEITERWLELTISKMDEDHLIHIFTDITPIKEAQLQLERTVEELKRSNANLQEFAYAASHDLKEPTRKIHVFAERLRNSLGDRMTESEQNYFKRMELASKRMSTLIDDLLTYTQVSQSVTLLESVDLNQVVEQVLNDLDLEIEQKGATIKVNPLFTIKGRWRQMQQAFQNLVGNALKYSKHEVAPFIEITCDIVKGSNILLPIQPGEQIKDFYEIIVKDNGIGFEQVNADRIFNVFTRLHGLAEYKGTGVGLSIVRKVIENHHGYISAQGEPDKGATFTIWLPVNND